MTAKDIISPRRGPEEAAALRRIDSATPLFDVLPRLLDTPQRSVCVEEDGEVIGVIDERSLLEAVGASIAPRDDASTIIVESSPEDYCASLMAHAAEDVDAPLLDLITVPTADGTIRSTLRVRHRDPSPVVRSLERYNFKVVDAYGPFYADAESALRNLEALNLYLNI